MFLPPLTTLVTRLMATTWSLSWRLPTSNFGLDTGIYFPGAKAPCNCTFISAGKLAFTHSKLKLQAGFAGGIGQGLHPAVIEVAAAVEDHLAHSLGFGALGDGLAHRLGRGQIAAGVFLFA